MLQDKTPSLTELLPKTPCAFTWSGINLSAPEWETQKNYDLSEDLSIEKAVAKLSSTLSLCKKLQVLQAAKISFKGNFSDEVFFKELGYTRLDLIQKTKELTQSLPFSFLSWCDQKKLNLKDFRIFLSDYQQKEHSKTFEHLALLDPTKSLGLQIIEFYFDLLAVDKINDSDILSFKASEKLFSFLKKKRFSESLSKDQIIEEGLSKLELSPGVKIEMKRNGDKRQIKLEIEVDSPEQLFKKMDKAKSKLKDLKQIWSHKS